MSKSESTERWDRLQRATSFEGLIFKKYKPRKHRSADMSKPPTRKNIRKATAYDPTNILHSLDVTRNNDQ
ncbi:MAG TPA: hypothetical protein VEW42_05460 [Candidatus Eisenbacteria bacterium]|nr:hypothetical protein [Candidatus Eisenbacteria bacterium]